MSSENMGDAAQWQRVDYSPNMCKTLGLIPSSTKQNKNDILREKPQTVEKSVRLGIVSD
jgi:hypothetical protein